MMNGILGLHHVTAISSDPQRTLDFYAGVLGLRFVKRTVNFDDPETYHFYFGDETGTPGSLMTFFPWPGARRGRQGSSQVAVTSLAVLPGALEFWRDRLRHHDVAHRGLIREGRGSDDEHVLALADPDGLPLEIVGHPGNETRTGWDGAPGIPRQHAIRGLHGVELWEKSADATERLLVSTLGFRESTDQGETRRYVVGDGGPGTIVSVREIESSHLGRPGAGTVHHVAFAVRDDDAQLAARAELKRAELQPTPVIDRRYFHSVYFNEPGGVLLEIATYPPGFTIDEPIAHLGESLMLPPEYERVRAELEAVLPPVHLPLAPAAPASTGG